LDYEIPLNCQVENLNKIYLDYFGYKTNGFFVDVGAYNGIDFSNTWRLAVAGWRGICYEPVLPFYNLCVQNHKEHNIKTVQTCIGNKTGKVDFYVAWTLSTYNEDHLHSEYWKNDYKNTAKIVSDITTLDQSLADNEIEKDFEVLSIDVEGAETDVLLGFNVEYWQPKMVIIEAQELHEAPELKLQAPFINDYFKIVGYSKIYCDSINNIYIRNKK
jgi:FkbM family methyltransferase